MNIGTLLGILGQQPRLPDEGQGLPAMGENGDSCFSQLLKTFFFEEDGDPLPFAPGVSEQMSLPLAQLKVLGQPGTGIDLTPDLLEEVSALLHRQRELPVTLTELMAVLQPIFNENGETEQPLRSGAEEETGESVSKGEGEPHLTALGWLFGANPVQPASSFVTLPSPEVDAAKFVAEASNSSAAQIFGKALEAGTPGQTAPVSLETSGKPVALSAQPEITAAPTQTEVESGPERSSISFSQELAQRMANGSKLPQSGNEVVDENPMATRAAAELPVENMEPILQPETFKVQASGLGGETPGVAGSPRLPDIPALHQIVEKISLMKWEDGTEVRLHLQPESLGRVLIQLNLVDGDVSVRMLAETLQAQSLIQDHLPQLKTALTAQGLQLNGLTVGVGSDASSFDLNSRQQNGWPQGATAQGHTASGNEIGQTVKTQPFARPWGSRHAVDYQV